MVDALFCPDTGQPLTDVISTISQPPLPSVPGLSYSEMLLLQQSCFKVQNLRQSSALKVVSVPVSSSELLCDVSTGVIRLLVPEPMRRAVFESNHKVSHPGSRPRFSNIHVDLVEPLPQSSDFSYLFTIIDRSTRWLEAIPLQSTTAEDFARVLLFSWNSLFRVPSVITSNHGAQFTDSIQLSLCKFLGIVHSYYFLPSSG